MNDNIAKPVVNTMPTTTWEKKVEGQLTIDHRASPGMPADLARKHGFDPSLVGEGKCFQTATFKCNHCGTPLVKNPWRVRARGHCFKCHSYICDGCNVIYKVTGECRTIAQVIDDVLDGKTSIPILARHKGVRV